MTVLMIDAVTLWVILTLLTHFLCVVRRRCMNVCSFYDIFKGARFGLAHLATLVVNEELAPSDLLKWQQPPTAAG